jgi:hypothetical protein
VSITQAPPAYIEINNSASVTAAVQNDPEHEGVNWSCAPAGSCGSFSPTHTASGVATTYTAPNSVPGNGAVTITATSVKDPTKFASAGTTITHVVVTFNPAPPTFLEVNNTSPLTAVVTDDPQNEGVNWSCTPVGSCGSFNPTHTASGVATTYTAPSSIPNGGFVTVTATSVANNSSFAQANISIGQIAVTWSQQPPSQMGTGSSTDVAATVTGDPTNSGLDWSCTPVGSCGSFNPTHTSSGSATLYTAPNTVPNGNSVTITAASTEDNTKNVSANVTITLSIIVTWDSTYPPPSYMPISTVQQIAADVQNDSQNAGVNWSCTPVGACGSFSPTQTGSTVPTNYTAPPAIPSGGFVTVTATSVTDNTKFVSANIVITNPVPVFDPQPTPFLLASGTASMTTILLNAPQNAGVDWSCTPSGSCGSFNPAHTNSGSATVYTAPSSATTVTIIADATDKPTRTTQTQVTVATQLGTAMLGGGCSGASTTCNYTFEATGRDSFAHVPPGAYQVAGVLQVDGLGDITGGELLYEDQPNASGSNLDTITGGSYSIGTDGRGTITIQTADTGIGVSGVLTFSLAMLSGTEGFITQFDTSATSSGRLDLQTPHSAATPLSGGYAFVNSGVDTSIAALGYGGVFNVDGPGTISGTGTVLDENDNGSVTTAATLNGPGTVASPDPLGKTVINLSPAFPNNPSITLIGFIVDDTHVKLIEKDRTFGFTGGIAFAQGTQTGNFTSFEGPIVYSTEGYSTVSSDTFQPTVYAGTFAADGSGNINGYTDENQFGNIISDTISGKYVVQSTGRVTTSQVFYGQNGQGPTWLFYLTGSTSMPALILQIDSSPFIETAGKMYTQSGSGGVSAFTGPYGLSLTVFPGTGGEDDGTGQVTANGTNSFSGNTDINIYPFTPTPAVATTGTYGSACSSGAPSTLCLGGTISASPVFSADPIDFYIGDSTRVLFIDMGNNPAVGVFQQQQ